MTATQATKATIAPIVEPPVATLPTTVRVGSVMTTDLVVASPTMSLLHAAKTMREKHLSGLPVVDDHGSLVGVLSEKDILRDLDRAAGIGLPRGLLDLLLELKGTLPAGRLEPCLRRLEHGRVADAMTTPPIFVDSGVSIGEASRLLRDHRIKRLPVVEHGRLVGLVTRGNLIDVLAKATHLADADGPWSRHHHVP